MHIYDGALVGAVIGNVSVIPAAAVSNPVKGIVISIIDTDNTPALTYQNYKFIQTEDLTKIGVAVHPYGAIIFNPEITVPLMTGNELLIVEFGGKQYGIVLAEMTEAVAGMPVSFELIEDEGGGGDDSNT